MSASRWQTVPVVICCTAAPLRASRRASLSVARSPTSAATRQRARSWRSVASRNAVLPAPGLDTSDTTKSPASRNRSRSAAARASFFFRMFFRTSTMRGTIDDLQRDQFQFTPLGDLEIEPGARDRCSIGGNVERERKRLACHTRPRSHADLDGANLDAVAELRQLLADRIHEAHRDRQLMHDERTALNSCAHAS